MSNISPRVDIAFKKIFGVEENKDLLISLINSIVGEADQGSEGPALPRRQNFAKRCQNHFRIVSEIRVRIPPPHFRFFELYYVGPGLTVKLDSPQKIHLFINTKHQHLPPL